MLPSRQTIASSDLLPLPHAPGAEMRLTLLPIEKLFLLWWILWSCGRCASVVQAKRQIHRVTAAITPGTLRLLVRFRIPAEERPRAAIPLARAGKFAAARPDTRRDTLPAAAPTGRAVCAAVPPRTPPAAWSCPPRTDRAGAAGASPSASERWSGEPRLPARRCAARRGTAPASARRRSHIAD